MDTRGQLVPADEDCQWLLDQLAALIRRHGFETFVTAPLLEPTDTFFPDPWEPTARGVRTVARRLLRYAGLGAYRAVVEVGDGRDETGDLDLLGHTQGSGHKGAAAWFAGLDGHACLFGIDERQIAQPDSLVGVMGHEVAHAFRAVHGLVVKDDALEEQLTDLTSVYLGMGVLLANSAETFRAKGEWQAMGYQSSWSHAQTGYLGPVALCFLLAAQCIARGLGSKERRELARHLETNQAASFRAACALLERDVAALHDHLVIPPRAVWPAPPTLEALLGPLGDTDADDDTDAEDGDAEALLARWDHGIDTARVGSEPRAHAFTLAPSLGSARVLMWNSNVYCAAPPETIVHAEDEPAPKAPAPLAARNVSSRAALAALLGTVLGGLMAAVSQAEVVLGGVLGAGLGAAAGALQRRARCGAEGCGAPVTTEAEQCPRCHSTLLPSDHPWLLGPG